jgi:hypothetical protein
MKLSELQSLVNESLRDWFKKEKWVRITTSGNIAGPCGTSKNKENPDRCLPKAKAQSLSKSERAATARKKKAAGSKGKQFVSNTKKAKVTRESLLEMIQEVLSEKKDDRCTRIAKSKYDSWPSAYASGAVVRCRKGDIWKGIKEGSDEEAWELVGQKDLNIAKVINNAGFKNDEESVNRLIPIIDNTPETTISPSQISNLKNFNNKPGEESLIRDMISVSKSSDSRQEYADYMKKRDEKENRNRGYNPVQNYDNVVKGNYEPPVLININGALYVIGGRTRLYAGLAANKSMKVKILNTSQLKEILNEYVKPAKESEVDPLELKKGIEVEMEHTDSSKVAKRIALQHLAEDPKYYTKLGTLKLQEQDTDSEDNTSVPDKVIIYHNFQGADISDPIPAGTKKVLKVEDCIGNEPDKDYNFFKTEKKEYIEKMIKDASGDGWKKFSPIIAIEHPLISGKYLVIDGNHRLGAFKIGKIPFINAVVLSSDKILVAKPGVEWEEDKIPETIPFKDIKGKINFREYFNTKKLQIPTPISESTTPGMIGPFFHETDSQNVDNILQNGIRSKGGSVSISPGERTNHYGDQVFEIYLTPVQFVRALEETLGWVEEDLPKSELENIEILLKSKGQDLIFNANQLIEDPLFMMGELVCPFSIPPSQIRLLDQKKNISLNKENFADGKVKGKSRPGRVEKAGASCKGSVTDLRAKAKKYGGEKGKMYHWCANMKSGKK